MQRIETFDWFYCTNRPSLTFITQMGDSEAVLYGSDDSRESNAMVELLNELGVKFDFRHIDRDPRALREWEQLDGDRVPMLRVGNNQIIRGFDRIRLQQLFGWVGC
jgi:hypothetical protein